VSEVPTYRVLVADAIAPEGVAILRGEPRLRVDERPEIGRDELVRIVGAYDALIVRSRTRVTAEVLDAGRRLKVVGRAGIGVDNIDVARATRLGILVLNAPAGNAISAAELTFALLLALARKVVRADRSVRAGVWDRASLQGVELHGKTLGLVGCGRIGSEVAKRARAFGMRVLAYDPYLSVDRAREVGVTLVTLPDLLEESDAVSIHAPLTEETRGLIGRAELARMKPTAFLLNMARGAIVDEMALADALRTGGLAGAALDVFAQEPPPPDHPLLRLENVIVTPHLGAATQEAQRSVGIEICRAVRDALLHGDVRTAVNAPGLAGGVLAEVAPLVDLAERLGRILGGVARGSYTALTVRYSGAREDALPPIAAAATLGLLHGVVAGPLNLVNALEVAAERGLTVSRSRSGPRGDVRECIELELSTPEGALRVAGGLVGDGHPRILQLLDYRVDLVPEGTILVLKNRDVPGVIGKVGTVLGAAGVNIAEYHQARQAAGGVALAAIAVDGEVDRSVVDRLAAIDEVLAVWPIVLPERPGVVSSTSLLGVGA
jgi:D-3-phosphoglycerate dehydrogenase